MCNHQFSCWSVLQGSVHIARHLIMLTH